jgi:hypothetical protein
MSTIAVAGVLAKMDMVLYEDIKTNDQYTCLIACNLRDPNSQPPDVQFPRSSLYTHCTVFTASIITRTYSNKLNNHWDIDHNTQLLCSLYASITRHRIDIALLVVEFPSTNL